MIISLRNMSYDELKDKISPDEKISLYSCNACIIACGVGGLEKMERLENLLKNDGYNVVGKDLISIGCQKHLIENRKTDVAKKKIYEEADVIIPLICEDGYEGISEIYANKKIIQVAKTLGVGSFTMDRGVVLNTPFKETGLDEKKEGYGLGEAAESLDLYTDFFDEESISKVEPEIISITIDGKQISAQKNRNLLKVCKDNGIEIPHLCHDDNLDKYGACRMCLVKIDGFRDLAASCCVEVAEGMNIITTDDELEANRKVILELAMASGDHNCLTCSKGVPSDFVSCQLQSLIRKYGITETQFDAGIDKKPIDDSSDVIFYDPNKCILCGKCVRACEEIAGLCNLGFINRGEKTTIVAGLNKEMKQTECVSCMACTDVCPTGALSEKVIYFSGKNWNAKRVLNS